MKIASESNLAYKAYLKDMWVFRSANWKSTDVLLLTPSQKLSQPLLDETMELKEELKGEILYFDEERRIIIDHLQRAHNKLKFDGRFKKDLESNIWKYQKKVQEDLIEGLN